VQPRQLNLVEYSDVADEIALLLSQDYEPLGQWSLGQVCDHLSYYYRGSLDGFDFKLPWLVRTFVGPFFLRRILSTGTMKPGLQTIPASVPKGDVNEESAINEALRLLERLDRPPGPEQPSPFFGKLTPEQWKRLHLIHSAHHLGFLLPLGRNDQQG
jgi:hypothetical protein